MTFKKRRTVLVVDDEPDVRRVVEALLTNGDTRLILVGSVEEAEAILAKTVVDVIILDHAMPGRTGLELAREVAATVPTVVLSAYVTPQMADAYTAVGVKACFDKPFDLLRFRSLVRKLAGLPT